MGRFFLVQMPYYYFAVIFPVEYLRSQVSGGTSLRSLSLLALHTLPAFCDVTRWGIYPSGSVACAPSVSGARLAHCGVLKLRRSRPFYMHSRPPLAGLRQARWLVLHYSLS